MRSVNVNVASVEISVEIEAGKVLLFFAGQGLVVLVRGGQYGLFVGEFLIKIADVMRRSLQIN